MFCTKCGKQAEDGQVFCTGCGKNLSGETGPAKASPPPPPPPVYQQPQPQQTTQQKKGVNIVGLIGGFIIPVIFMVVLFLISAGLWLWIVLGSLFFINLIIQFIVVKKGIAPGFITLLIFTFLAGGALVVSLVAGGIGRGFQVESAVTSYAVSRDFEAVYEDDMFSRDTPQIYLAFTYDNATPEDSITAVWSYEGTEEVSYTITDLYGAYSAYFSLSIPDDGWPVGNYSVSLISGESTLETVDFQVVQDGVLDNKTFFLSNIGLAFKYPSEWVYEIPDDASVIIGGREGTADYQATISIVNILPEYEGGIYETLEDLADDHISQILDANGNVGDVHEDEFFHTAGKIIRHLSFSAVYTLDGEHFHQWVYMLEGNGDVFHQIVFTAPYDNFENYEDVFNQTLSTMHFLN